MLLRCAGNPVQKSTTKIKRQNSTQYEGIQQQKLSGTRSLAPQSADDFVSLSVCDDDSAPSLLAAPRCCLVPGTAVPWTLGWLLIDYFYPSSLRRILENIESRLGPHCTGLSVPSWRGRIVAPFILGFKNILHFEFFVSFIRWTGGWLMPQQAPASTINRQGMCDGQLLLYSSSSSLQLQYTW